MNNSPSSPHQYSAKILFEDSACIVFDKPAGWLVIPTPKGEKHTLTAVVNATVAKDQDWQLHPCHRLDRETSGAILYAKGKKNQQLLMDLFVKQTIEKVYVAFVQGTLKFSCGEIKTPIKDFSEHRFNKNSRAKWALTRYKVAARKKDFTVVDVFPVTGRTNQIRIHFSDIGHPLVGERVYAFGRDFALKFRRVALHARSLKWHQLNSGKDIFVQSPLAEDMEQFCSKH